MVRRGALALGLLTVGCEPSAPADDAQGMPSSSAPAIASSAVVEVSSAPVAAAPAPKALTRKTSPVQRYAAAKTGCEAGDKGACRALADRHSRSGPRAGCGVPRGRSFPALNRTPGDVAVDRDAFTLAVRKACRAGDQDACAVSRVALVAHDDIDASSARWGGMLSSSDEVGLRVFRASGKPEWKAAIEKSRDACLLEPTASSCDPPKPLLFQREKPDQDGKLPAELRTRAERACERTRDCNDVYVALDRSGYAPAELAPLRASFAKTLIEGCLEGDCTCGDATRYLEPTDTRWFDLGALGCENGEAEGCYALGRAYELGIGVEKDAAKALELYHAACPDPVMSSGDYSAHACDRLGEMAIGESFPGKNRSLAKHYLLAACRTPGYEIDHAPCVRLGMLWATRPIASGGDNAHQARMVAMGEASYGADRPHLDDCRRPSVAEPCNVLREALKKAK